MLEKLLQHSNLGSRSQIIYIVNLLSKGDLCIIYNQFFIKKEFLKWFIDNAVPLIESSQTNAYSLSDLKNKQNKQEELGVKAERFVLVYEKNKKKKTFKI